MFGVGPDGSRRIQPAHVGRRIGPDGARRIQKDLLDDQAHPIENRMVCRSPVVLCPSAKSSPAPSMRIWPAWGQAVLAPQRVCSAGPVVGVGGGGCWVDAGG